ncbi:MAG: SOS response-associated peptidase [Clostridiales bacterium]|nr:SOS response-associated peptidase [Clostridiales bacterium]
MCGRYNFTVEQSEEIQEILEKVNAKFHGKEVKTGEIFPTNAVPILIREDKGSSAELSLEASSRLPQGVSPVISNWGFPKFDQKGVIINARSETAFEKRTFRDSLLNRRCIIPSTGFYEWDSSKQKFLFRQEGTNALYMAGLYSFYQGEMRFVILTTQANDSMKAVHHRMPLVIPRDEIETWIFDYDATNAILKRTPPQLIMEAV